MNLELSQKSKHENNFTMIHIVAAIMIIIGHQFVLEGAASANYGHCNSCFRGKDSVFG